MRLNLSGPGMSAGPSGPIRHVKRHDHALTDVAIEYRPSGAVEETLVGKHVLGQNQQSQTRAATGQQTTIP